MEIMSFFIRSIVNHSFKIHQEVSLDPTYLSILDKQIYALTLGQPLSFTT